MLEVDRAGDERLDRPVAGEGDREQLARREEREESDAPQRRFPFEREAEEAHTTFGREPIHPAPADEPRTAFPGIDHDAKGAGLASRSGPPASSTRPAGVTRRAMTSPSTCQRPTTSGSEKSYERRAARPWSTA